MNINIDIKDHLIRTFTYYVIFCMSLAHMHEKTNTQIHTATCSDGDLKLVGGASETEGRLEVCFNKRWGTIDGDGWTQTDTQVACKQLGHSTSGKTTFNIFLQAVFSFHAEVFYSKETRFSTQSLPVHMTSVVCNSSSKALIDCDYHEFPSSSTTSVDIHINCGLCEPSA